LREESRVRQLRPIPSLHIHIHQGRVIAMQSDVEVYAIGGKLFKPQQGAAGSKSQFRSSYFVCL
jgi:hypothetical protein